MQTNVHLKRSSGAFPRIDARDLDHDTATVDIFEDAGDSQRAVVVFVDREAALRLAAAGLRAAEILGLDLADVTVEELLAQTQSVLPFGAHR